jgi:hypothetical protein
VAKRVLVSPIIGTGTKADPYRPKAKPVAGGVTALIPTDSAGAPVRAWCLCVAAGADLSTIIGDADNEVLPNLSLDQLLSVALTNAQFNSLITRLQNRGIDTTGLTRTGSQLRHLIRAIGRFLEANFDENRLDVRDG